MDFVNALDMGVAAPTIAEAVFARCLSALKEERVKAATILAQPQSKGNSQTDSKKKPPSKRFTTPYLLKNLLLPRVFN